MDTVRTGLGRLGSGAEQAWRSRRWGGVVKVTLAYVVGVEILVQLIFGRLRVPLLGLDIGRYDLAVPRGVFLGGMVIGSLYGLVAMGLILVYRANRVINFAQAQLGAVPAIVALLLIAQHGVPYIVEIGRAHV